MARRAQRLGMLRWLRLMLRLEWPLRLLSPLIGLYDPFVRAWREDPYPRYRALREAEPVYWSRFFRIHVLTRHEDVHAVLVDPRFSVRRSESDFFKRFAPFESLSPDFQEMIWRNLLMIDPPDHTRLRGLVNRAFTPRRVDALRPRVQAIVDDLLDRVEAAGEMELIRDFASPLPVTVIAELLGLPADERSRYRRWADDISALLDPLSALDGLDAAQASFDDMSAWFRDAIAERRARPGDDLLSALAAAEDAGGALSEAEVISTAALVLGAGHLTTTHLIGNAVLALLANPGERKRLRDDPSLTESAVEEFLRYDSPVQATDRLALEDCEIRGRRIRKGKLVVLLLGAANRDPERFPDPDRLDLGRSDNHHLAFSQGAHYCLGAPLARVEAEIALRSLLDRFPDFDGERDPERELSMTLRGPRSLAITLR